VVGVPGQHGQSAPLRSGEALSQHELRPARCAAEYRSCRARIGELVDGLEAGVSGGRVPACPEWSVSDVVAHLAGVAEDLLQGRGPHGDLQAWIDTHVKHRQGRPVRQLWLEWDGVGPRFEALIVESPGRFAGLLYDVIAHEHDLRGALARPGARDVDGIWLSLDTEVRLLDADLREAGLGALGVSCGGREWRAGEGDPVIHLAVDDGWELFRALGSRRSESQLRALAWDRDPGLWLAAFHLPLPATDLVE